MSVWISELCPTFMDEWKSDRHHLELKAHYKAHYKASKIMLLPVLFSVLCQDIMTADSLSQGLNQPPSGQLKTRSTTWAAALVQNLTIVTGTFSVFFVKNDKYYCTLLRSCDLLSVRKCISMSPLYYPPGGRSIVSTSRTIPIELKRKKC